MFKHLLVIILVTIALLTPSKGMDLASSAGVDVIKVDYSEADWINAGKFVGQIDGTLCCGPLDCKALDPGDVRMNPDGSFYIFSLKETVPAFEAQWKSPDGRYWRCWKPDGSRRCFFAPPPGS